MRKHLLFLFVFLITGTILFFSTIETGYTHASGGSTIAGNSGSPYDGSNCTGCHTGRPTQAPSSWITSNIPVNGYTPGATYTITCKAVDKTSGHNSNFGFEFTPQNQSTGKVVGVLGNIKTSGTGSTTIASGEWITHTSSSYTGTDSCTWAFTWTAPSPGVGAVNCYAIFNCGSSDNASSSVLYWDSLHFIENVNAPPPCVPHYASLPYSTSFENAWIIDSCDGGAQRIPDIHWKTSIGGTSPDGDDYWHRNDYTGTDWTSPTSGAYTPVASNGSYSARFHNYPPPAGSIGTMDLYVNLSSPGTKTISFDYIHNEASVSPFAFNVELSTDGGKTFSTTLLTITSAQVSSWTKQTVTTTATSSTSVIRFTVTDKGTADVGIDNLSISTAPTGIAQFSNEENLNAYPNPFKQNFTVNYNLSQNEPVNMYLVDMFGRVIPVHSSEMETEGQHTLNIDFSSLNLAKGIYVLQLQTGSSNSYFKLVAE